MRSVETSAVCLLGSALAGFGALCAHAQGFGGGPSVEPSAMRQAPAETTAAAVANRNWKAPRTS